jgi:hypothetical protein
MHPNGQALASAALTEVYASQRATLVKIQAPRAR